MTTPVLSYSKTGSNLVTVDLARLISSKLLVQAASGGGKSWAIRQLCEEVFGKVPLIILDPEGEFHTLREKYDFVLAAIRGGDIEASPKTAATLARRLVEIGGNCVIDMSEMKPDQQRLFVRRFLESMLALPRELWRPLVLVVDEFHLFAPEKGHGEAESLDACADASTRFRKRGFCLVGATTRIAKLHKDVAGNLHNKMIGFNSLDVDIDRAAKELGFNKEGRETIRKLDPGSFYVYGPAISKEVTLVRTGPVKTTHPEPGMTVAVAAVPPSSKVKALIASSLADIPKEAEEEARTIDELRKQRAELERKLKAAERGAPKEGWVPHSVMASQIDAAVKAARREERKIAAHGEEAILRLRSLLKMLRTKAVHAVQLSKDTGELIDSGLIDIDEFEKRKITGESRGDVQLGNTEKGTGANHPPVSTAGQKARSATRPAVTPSTDGSVPPVQQRVLNAIADLNALGIEQPTRKNIGAWLGVSSSTGSFKNYLGALRTAGLISYPTEGEVELTAAGRAAAQTGEGPQSLAELHAVWQRKLPPVQWRVLDQVLKAHPDPVSRAHLGQVLNVSHTTGSFKNYLGALRSLGLIDYPEDGAVIATDLLFPKGLR